MIASALLTTSAATAWAALGWSVIHFLWQGTLIGLCTAVLLDALPRREASARYLLAFGALLACLLAFVATLCLLMPTSAPSSSADAALQAASFSHLPPLAISLLDVPAIAAWCWSLGVLCMSMRFARHWMWTRRLETESILVPDEQWQQLFRSIKRELGVDRAVRFLQSTLVDTPMVVGWIAPAVLIPVSAFSALTPGQLRSLLAHELAHIRRHDHLLNLLQCAIESLLFFHPITWWISKQVRQEREHCCDDASARSTKDRTQLAEALTQLESIRLATPALILASNGGSLMNRISRLLGNNTQSAARLGDRSFFAGSLALLLCATGLASVGAGCVNGESAKTITREQYAGRAEAIEQMVADGELSREDADTRLGEMRRMIKRGADDEAQASATMTREEYARAAEAIEQAVADGEVSREDADIRLGEMRRMISRER